MESFHYPIAVGPRDGSRFESLRAAVNTGSTYTVVPALILARLGIEPEWTAVFDLPDGRQQENSLAEVRLRIDDQERMTICVFGRPESGTVLGSYTLTGFGLAPNSVNRRLEPVRPSLGWIPVRTGKVVQSFRKWSAIFRSSFFRASNPLITDLKTHHPPLTSKL